MEPHYFRALIEKEQLQARIHELSDRISHDYAGSPLLVVGVLKGAFMFFSDLVRHMSIPVSVDFVTASSYSGMNSSGTVRITHDYDAAITGRHVLIVDDIADTRMTLLRILEDFQRYRPASIRIACLLNKASRARFSVPLDYVGFEIPDEFVIGYGMDLDGAYRSLPYIAVYDAKAVEPIDLLAEIKQKEETKKTSSTPVVSTPALSSSKLEETPQFAQNNDSSKTSNSSHASLSSHAAHANLGSSAIALTTDYTAYGLLLHISKQSLKTIFGDFRVDVFQNLYTRSYVLVVAKGDLSTPEPLLIRVHSSCITSEAFGAYDCDCSEQLNLALQQIGEAGRGAIVYLLQEGRGAGYSAKARDRMLVQASEESKTTFEAYAQLGLSPDHRRYSEVSLALRIIGVHAPIRLLTNNPDKAVELEKHGLQVIGLEPVLKAASPYNAHYLTSKRHAGHKLDSVVVQGIIPPEKVHAFPPTPLESAPHLVQMASYLLPLRASFQKEHSWFWSHVYFDLLAGCERVVLTHRAQTKNNLEQPPYVRIQRESLLERFPIEQGIHKRQWQATVDEIIRYGNGMAIFPTADGYDEAFAATLIQTGEIDEQSASRRLMDQSVYQLLAHHVPGRTISPIFTSIDQDESRRKVTDEFDRRGFRRAETVFLPI